MAVEGRLEDLELGAVLQLLVLSANSGRLSLTQSAGEGLIILRKGKIIFAASSSARETLGNILICKGLLSERQLEQALEIQLSSGTERRLGTILVEEGFVSQKVLEDSVAAQVQRTMRELLGWKEGFYRFDRFEVQERGEVEIEIGDFVVGDGIAADKLLLDSITGELEGGEEPGEEPRSLTSAIGEFRTPSLTGEITMPLLRSGRGLTRRGALFSASPRGFAGVGQFGFGSDDASGAEIVRAIRLPLSEPSVFRRAIARRGPEVVEPADTPANRELLRQLGGGWPRSVLVAPLIVSGRVLMILYGDNLPTDEPIQSIGGLRQALFHSSLTMETSLLEKRTEYAVRLRRADL